MRHSVHLLDALTMCLLNLGAAAVLTALHLINRLYDWPNPFVTVAAPLAAAVFAVLTAVWFLESVRRYRTRLSATAAGHLQPTRLRQSRPVLVSPALEPQSWRRLARGALGR